jgi:hypothetical protein
MTNWQANATSEISKVAVPIFKIKIKDAWSTCISLMKIKQEICGDNFVNKDCDPQYSKRPDSKALFITFTDQIKAKFYRTKPVEAVAAIEENSAISSSSIDRRTILYIALAWIFAIAIIAIVFLRPGKKCPNCGHDLPKFRIPNDVYELIGGGWTCQNCGTKLTYGLKKRL